VYKVLESAEVVELTVLRQNGASGTAVVHYATEDGTAVAGHDYIATKGKIIFEDGETAKTIAIKLIDDTEPGS
jgi:hypothetical protein